MLIYANCLLLTDYLALYLRANARASALLLNPHLRSASANLLGLDRVPMPPRMPPNLAAKLILRGDVPLRSGAFRFEPVVRLKKFLPLWLRPPLGFWYIFLTIFFCVLVVVVVLPYLSFGSGPFGFIFDAPGPCVHKPVNHGWLAPVHTHV